MKKAGKRSTISTENEVEKEEGGRGIDAPLYNNKERPSSSHAADRDFSAALGSDKTGVPGGTPRGITPLEEGTEKLREMTAYISSQFPEETWSFRQLTGGSAQRKVLAVDRRPTAGNVKSRCALRTSAC